MRTNCCRLLWFVRNIENRFNYGMGHMDCQRNERMYRVRPYGLQLGLNSTGRWLYRQGVLAFSIL